MGFLGPIVRNCGCYFAVGRVPDKYLGITVDANEYDERGNATVIRNEEPQSTTEHSGWTYCKEHKPKETL